MNYYRTVRVIILLSIIYLLDIICGKLLLYLLPGLFTANEEDALTVNRSAFSRWLFQAIWHRWAGLPIAGQNGKQDSGGSLRGWM
jgi:hypothetical protein